MQDGFYTGNGRIALAVRIKNGEIYLLRSQDMLIGVGFVSPLGRTPDYADIAMIIDGRHRMQGFAVQLVKQLIQISLHKGLIPTALTSPQNIASRKTLEKCGFFIDGCMLLAKIN
jgi:RimJ/RimL family protein N-acetyltransferase